MKNILLLSLLTLMTGVVNYAAPITKSYKLDLSAPGKPVKFDGENLISHGHKYSKRDLSKDDRTGVVYEVFSDYF